MKKATSLVLMVLGFCAFSLLSSQVAWADSCQITCPGGGTCSVQCDSGKCASCRCVNGYAASCHCRNCGKSAPENIGFTFQIGCADGKLDAVVGFVSYLLGVQILTEFPVPNDPYALSTGGEADALALLAQLAEETGGWVRIGEPLPENYSPPAQYQTWAGENPVLAYQDNRQALLDLLGGDTIQPSEEARELREEYERAAPILNDIQNALEATQPKIDLTQVCETRTIAETLQAVSYGIGYQHTLQDPTRQSLTIASLSCGEVGIPALLRWVASWLNTPITVNEAMPYLPLEAIPDWIREAVSGGLYLYPDRNEWIAVLGGESVLPDPDWSLLFQD